MDIDYLADRPEYVAALARLVTEHYAPILKGELASRLARFESHLNRHTLPIAWVAPEDGGPLGTAALRLHDLEAARTCRPGWAASSCAARHGGAGSEPRCAAWWSGERRSWGRRRSTS